MTGHGASLAGGRWNSKGTKVVYTSESLALASVELFVHVDPATVPDDLVAVPVTLHDSTTIEAVAEGDLPPNWRNFPFPIDTQKFGDAWVTAQRSLALSLPSTVIPSERNILLNPEHPTFSVVSIGLPIPFSFDPRMWKSSTP